jgi:DNA-binding SARP family transcriptional activator
VLFEALWPKLDAPRGSLKVAVHMLRNILSAEHSAANGKSESGIRILTHECGYSMETSNVWIDFQEFDSLIRRTQREGNNAPREQVLTSLRAAADLYQGEFLPGTTMPWAEPQREWLRSLALSALRRLVAAATQDGDDMGVVHYGCRLIEIEPLHEETYRTLIRLNGQLGQIGQADRWYKLCASRLRKEIGIGPDEETRSVYSQAVRGELVTSSGGRTGPLKRQSSYAAGSQHPVA